jgi:small subunit ribosomal protein S4
MGMAESRRDARQLVLHGHFRLNGKKVTIPSISTKIGDVISVREESKSSAKIKELIEKMQATKSTPKWLECDSENLTAKVVAIPEKSDIDFEFQEQLIVELYSK